MNKRTVCPYVGAAAAFAADAPTAYLAQLSELTESLQRLAARAAETLTLASVDELPRVDPYGLRRHELDAVRCELAASHRHLQNAAARLKRVGPKCRIASQLMLGDRLVESDDDDEGGL